MTYTKTLKDNNDQDQAFTFYECGDHVVTEYLTSEQIEQHYKKCRVCKILNGESKAKKLTDSELIDLFYTLDLDKANDDYIKETLVLCLDYRHTKELYESNNFKLISFYRGIILKHNWQICRIRTKDHLIENTQHESRDRSMFHRLTCPIYSEYNQHLELKKILLPMDFIIQQLRQLENINEKQYFKVIDYDQNTEDALIKIFDKIFFITKDENNYNAIELNGDQLVTNLKDAKESLIPYEARNTEYKRQGDLFFIPTNYAEKDLILLHEHRPSTKDLKIGYPENEDRIFFYRKELHSSDDLVDDYFKEFVNHTAKKIFMLTKLKPYQYQDKDNIDSNIEMFVKTNIVKHLNNGHKNLKLDPKVIYRVLKANQKESIDLLRGGGD